MRRASTMILTNWSEANFEHAGQSKRMEKLTAPGGRRAGARFSAASWQGQKPWTGGARGRAWLELVNGGSSALEAYQAFAALRRVLFPRQKMSVNQSDVSGRVAMALI
jgi:hypothetical protein